jgi:subtilisin family serine protease
MKRNLLIKLMMLLCISNFNIGIAANKPDNYYAYTPDGKVDFKISETQILIKFIDGVSFEQQANFLRNESLLKPLTKQMLLPAPKVTVALTEGNIGEEKLNALLERLKQSNLVQYANPFLIYKDGSKQGITDKFIVKLKQISDRELLNSMVKDNGLEIAEQYKYDNNLFIIKVPKQTGFNALQMANKFYETSKFASSEPDFLLLLKKFNTNDTFLSYQWSLNNTGSSIQYSGTAGCDMKVFNAWGISTGNSSIKVAIIDEGVDLVHPDLQANLLSGYDATGQNSGGAPSGDDAHGTACAGIVAGIGNNSTGIAGVAYNCKIIPVRIAYSDANGNWVTSNSSIGTAIDWAWQTAGADVLSNSWGGGSSSTLINDAIDRAVTLGRGGLGAPVIFAAGNDNGAVSYPATLTNVISVTAMSMCNQRKSTTSCDGETFWGSNYGTNTDVSAPGVKIYTCDISGSSGYSSGNYTATFNGTSSACPNTAGVMALILSVNPSLTMASARQIIETTCDKVGGYTYNSNVSGQPNGTWSNDLGYGRVNAFAALQLANPVACTSPPAIGTATANPVSICAPTTVALSLSGVTIGTGQTYQWQSSPNNSTWTNISGATGFTYNVSVSSATYFRCIVTCNSLSSNSTSILVNFLSSAITSYPHVENFDASSAVPCGWLVENVNADSKTWNIGTTNPRSSTNCVTYSYNVSEAANDWLFTPALTMTAGSTYRVRFWYRARSSSYPEKLEIKWGNAQNSSAMTSSTIFSNSNITNTSYTEGVTTVIAPANAGTYYVGFRVFSAADMYDLHIDDVTIEQVSTGCTTPTVGGTASLISPIESGSNSTFTLTGYNGTSLQWEISSNAGASWNSISGATSAIYTAAFYLGTYQVRARVSRTNCTDAYSNVVNLVVNPKVGDNFNLPVIVNTTNYSGNFSNTSTSGFTNQYNGQSSADIYFKVTTGACIDSLEVSTCGSAMDTYLTLLNSSGNLITFNDDDGNLCSGTPASIKVAVLPNTVYYVVAEGYNTTTGSFTLNILQKDNPILSANITPSGSTTFCSGSSVVLTSSSSTGNLWSNGATTPSITVSTSGNYSVTVTNTNGCSATSSNTVVTVNPSVTPTITISTASNSVCDGASTVFTAGITNGGTTPSYQWKINGNNVGTNSNTFTTSTLINSQIITCVLTSNANCASPTTATSNSLTMTVTNCSGVPTTQLRTADCGKQNLALNAAILCDAVSGATNYDFEFTNLTNSVVGVKTTTTNSVSLSSITPAIQFGTQYNVRVRAKVGGIYGNYGPVCVIGTVCNPSICGVPLTQLRSTDCGKLNFSPLTGQVIADAVAAASQYEFEFRNISTNAVYATKLQSSNVLALNTVTPTLQWNTQYNVKVRAYIAGVAGTYGSNCVIGFIPDPSVSGVPNTQLSTASCGKTNLALTSSITCLAVTGAGSYEWEFKNQANTTVVATKTTTSTSLNLSTVTGLQWNTQYNVRVRAYIGTVAGNYNVSCLIGIIQDPALSGVPSTKIRTSDCGKLNFGLGGVAVADVVSGASEYEFEIRNNTTNAFIANKIQSSNVLTFSTVPAFQWNTQYKISVRAKISTTWGTFGTPCTIGFICDPSLCGVPSTALRTSDCGKLNVAFSTGYVVANTVAGATSYEFEITDLTSNLVVSVQSRSNPNLYINTISPALLITKQYGIKVRAVISGVSGVFGNSCTIGFASGSREHIEEFTSESSVIESNFKVQVYPNPFQHQSTLYINGEHGQYAQILLYDIIGNLILNTQVNINESFNFGEELSNGNYIMKVISSGGAQSIYRLIKTQ